MKPMGGGAIGSRWEPLGSLWGADAEADGSRWALMGVDGSRWGAVGSRREPAF